jgi:hypothetical protein
MADYMDQYYERLHEMECAHRDRKAAAQAASLPAGDGIPVGTTPPLAEGDPPPQGPIGYKRMCMWCERETLFHEILLSYEEDGVKEYGLVFRCSLCGTPSRWYPVAPSEDSAMCSPPARFLAQNGVLDPCQPATCKHFMHFRIGDGDEVTLHLHLCTADNVYGGTGRCGYKRADAAVCAYRNYPSKPLSWRGAWYGWCPNCERTTAHGGWDHPLYTDRVLCQCNVCGQRRVAVANEHIKGQQP